MPDQYKVLTIKVPARAYDALMDAVPIEDGAKFADAVINTTCAVDKDAVKRSIANGTAVPGATTDQAWRVERK